jgi:hypothetical protein
MFNLDKPKKVFRLNYACEDMTPIIHAILESPDIHPVIMSGYGPVEWCPASVGINAPCANMPPGIGISEATVVFSDSSFIQYDAPIDIRELLGEDVYTASLNLAQTLLAAVRIDLGNRNPNNFFFNLSLVNATLFKKINSLDSLLYSQVLKQVDGKPESASALVPGPATIQRVYSCNWQIQKPVGSAIMSVMVATITMFMTGWQIVMLLLAALASSRSQVEMAMAGEEEPILLGMVGEHSTAEDSEIQRDTATASIQSQS